MSLGHSLPVSASSLRFQVEELEREICNLKEQLLFLRRENDSLKTKLQRHREKSSKRTEGVKSNFKLELLDKLQQQVRKESLEKKQGQQQQQQSPSRDSPSSTTSPTKKPTSSTTPSSISPLLEQHLQPQKTPSRSSHQSHSHSRSGHPSSNPLRTTPTFSSSSGKKRPLSAIEKLREQKLDAKRRLFSSPSMRCHPPSRGFQHSSSSSSSVAPQEVDNMPSSSKNPTEEAEEKENKPSQEALNQSSSTLQITSSNCKLELQGREGTEDFGVEEDVQKQKVDEVHQERENGGVPPRGEEPGGRKIEEWKGEEGKERVSMVVVPSPPASPSHKQPIGRDCTQLSLNLDDEPPPPVTVLKADSTTSEENEDSESFSGEDSEESFLNSLAAMKVLKAMRRIDEEDGDEDEGDISCSGEQLTPGRRRKTDGDELQTDSSEEEGEEDEVTLEKKRQAIEELKHQLSMIDKNHPGLKTEKTAPASPTFPLPTTVISSLQHNVIEYGYDQPFAGPRRTPPSISRKQKVGLPWDLPEKGSENTGRFGRGATYSLQEFCCRDCGKAFCRRGDRDNHEQRLNHLKWRNGRALRLPLKVIYD